MRDFWKKLPDPSGHLGDVQAQQGQGQRLMLQFILMNKSRQNKFNYVVQ